MIDLSLTIEIYIAGVKNRAGFATECKTTHVCFMCSIEQLKLLEHINSDFTFHIYRFDSSFIVLF